MLDGRPESGCEGVEAAAYRLDGPPPVVDPSDGGICAAAAARGFARVIVMEPARRGQVNLRTLSCPAR